MILKIATGDNAWRFIDRIKSIQTFHYTSQKYNEQYLNAVTRQYDDFFLNYHTIGEVSKNDPTKIYGNAIPDIFWQAKSTTVDAEWGLVELIPVLDNGMIQVYLADLSVYLLSDEGKTIERIH